jgi:hypothetical protein
MGRWHRFSCSYPTQRDLSLSHSNAVQTRLVVWATTAPQTVEQPLTNPQNLIQPPAAPPAPGTLLALAPNPEAVPPVTTPEDAPPTPESGTQLAAQPGKPKPAAQPGGGLQPGQVVGTYPIPGKGSSQLVKADLESTICDATAIVFTARHDDPMVSPA